MSRFKTAPVADHVSHWVERKRKGRMIRKQNTVTGKWTPWLISEFTAPRSYRIPAQVITDTFNANATGESIYGRMTVAELRSLANDRGIKVLSKARKADIIIALTEPR